MQVENVTRVSFTARRTTQQQRDLTIGPGLLGQIVIDDQCVFTTVTEVFAHGAARVGCQELHRCRVGCAGGHDNGVFHCAVLFELAYHVGNGRLLLTDGHVDTGNALAFLVNDGVDGNSRFTNLTVTDDQLTLTTSDRHHGIDGLETGLDWLINRLARDNTRSDFFHRIGQLGVDVALAIDGVTQRIHHTALQLRAYRYFEDATGTAGSHALFQLQIVTQHHRAYGVALKVEHHAVDAAGEFDHFAEHGVFQAVNFHDAIGDADDSALITGLRCDIQLFNTLFDDVANLGRIQLLHAMSLRLRR